MSEINICKSIYKYEKTIPDLKDFKQIGTCNAACRHKRRCEPSRRRLRNTPEEVNMSRKVYTLSTAGSM